MKLEIRDDLSMTQAELSELLGVDRTTVTSWQREGMPYQPGGRGKANRYIAPVVVNWCAGPHFIKHHHLNITHPPLVALLGQGKLGPDDPELEQDSRRLANRMNLKDREFNRLFGQAQGIFIGLRLL